MALAAGHQVAVPFLPQPLDPILGRHPPIHHHQGPPGRLERLQHLGQGAGVIHPAGKDLGAAHKPGPVQHQPQRQQGTVAALILRVPPLGLGLTAGRPFEEGVGQIEQGDGRPQIEQTHGPSEQVGLDGLAVFHQSV